MSASSPPEAFRLPDVRRSPLPAARVVRASSVAMVVGTAALVGGVLVDMAGGVLAARPDLFLPLDRLEGPLFGLGQVLLVGGAIVRRLARRQQVRDAGHYPHEDERTGSPPAGH